MAADVTVIIATRNRWHELQRSLPQHEGPVILQKETDVSENDTLGSVYFDRLFPMGVQAMLEAADLVVSNKHREVVQDESKATYEGWCRKAEARQFIASEPDDASDRAYAPTISPAARRGKYFCFCSSVPK